MRKNEEEKIKVVFINTYIGDLGIFYRGRTYELSGEQFRVLASDCKEIK
jgi:hypothetical protein